MENNTEVVKLYHSPLTPHASPLFKALPPLALYIHIPWCVKKCPYCDFNSHEIRPQATEQNAAPEAESWKSPRPCSRPGASHAESRGHFNSHEARGEVPEKQYVAALIADLESALPQIWGRKIHSVFFGGGTPSVFSAESLDAILAAVRARVNLDAYAEITLEANPGTFETEKFAAFRAAGINRLSIGIQSFNPRHLKALGRIHDDKEARRAIEIAQRHFDNFNLDLMYALPGQTLEEARADIETALSFAPPHISAYHLTLEPNTLFHRYPPPLPDDELSAQMQEMIEDTLAAKGYTHYETSAFARKNLECRHNLNYWRFGDYLGIGAGAHSKISFPEKIIRQMRYKQPQEYLALAPEHKSINNQHIVSTSELGFEFMMNALRLIEGFPVSLFEERTGVPISAVQKELNAAEQKSLITRDHQRIAPTLRGQRFLNDLLQIFLPD
ncbi:MAG: radical SAM family heme chaperone HemW [Burkholderiales bacterium]